MEKVGVTSSHVTNAVPSKSTAFYRCYSCGRYLPERVFVPATIEKNEGRVCVGLMGCGSKLVKIEENPSLFMQLCYLFFHPSFITWPKNWKRVER